MLTEIGRRLGEVVDLSTAEGVHRGSLGRRRRVAAEVKRVNWGAGAVHDHAVAGVRVLESGRWLGAAAAVGRGAGNGDAMVGEGAESAAAASEVAARPAAGTQDGGGGRVHFIGMSVRIRFCSFLVIFE